MKGLVYREWILSRKIIFAIFSVGVLFGSVGFLILLSAKVGNLSLLPPENAVDTTVLSYVMSVAPCLIMMFSAIGASTVIFRDAKTRWMTYSHVLPATPVQSVLSRYCLAGLVLPIALLAGMVNVLVIRGTEAKEIDGYIIRAILLGMAVVCIALAIEIPLALKYKEVNAVMVRMAIPAMLAFTGGFVFLMNKASKLVGDPDKAFVVLVDWMKKFMDKGVWAFILLIPISLGISFYISLRIYKGEER